jgi:hypothetical protein
VITDASKISDLLAANDITVVSENGSVEVRELSPNEVAFGGDSVGADQPSNASAVNFAATPTASDTVRQIGGFGVSLEPSANYVGPAFSGGSQVVYFNTANFGVVNASVQNALAGDFIRLEASKPVSFPDNVAAHLNAFVAFDTPRMIYSDIGSVSTETAGGMFADTEIRFMLETADGRFYLSEQTMNGNALAQTLTMPSIDGALWAEFSPDTDGDWRGNYDSLTFDQVLDPFEVVARMGVFSSRAVSATAIDVSSVLTVLSFDVGVRETLRQDIAIDSVDGVVTLTAADNIFQNASIRAVNGGQINLHAEGGLIRMDDGVLSSGSVAEIVYEANGNVELSTLQSGSGNISVVAGDRITDNRLTDDANLMTPALVTLSAVNGIGVFGASDILTDIGSLTATNTESGDIVIRERDGLVIAPDGVTTLVGDSSVIITAEEGDFTVNGDVSVSGAGRLLLNALGNSAAADLAVNARIETAAGSISLRAQDDLSFSNEGSATVAAGMGTLDLQAIDGLLTMAAASLVQTNGTNIRLLAQETVTLSIVDARSNVARLANTLDDQATWGDLTVRSVTGAILDARDRLDGSTAIYANAARFLAIGGIGQTGVGVDNPINLEATLLAASTTQGVINILEVTAIVVGSIDPLSVDRVDTDANVSSVGDANNLSGLTTSALVGGAVVMRTIDGTLVVENVVSTAGNGPILLQASGADSDILLNANVVSSSGPISIQAEDSITVDPSVLVQTGGAGTIDVFAVDGSVDMADTSRALASSGSLRIEAGGDILLSNAESLANVALIAGGSVLDNGDTRRDVLAAGLLIQAGVGVGTLGIGANPLEISVNTLTARAGSGGVNLRESNALSIGQLKVDVIRVAGDASTATETTGEQAGVRTTEDNGSVVIRLSEGNLSLAHTPLMTDQIALATHGEGNVLLETLGNFTNIGLSGGIETGGGHVTLVATSAVSLGAFAQIAVIGAGDVAIFSNFGGIAMNGTSRITSVTGHIRLSSSGDILVGGIETQGTVSLITLGASVLNNSSTQINVTADALRLQADVGIGTLVPFGAGDVVPLKTDVNTLSARSVVGNITLEEVDGLTVDDVGITVNRVEVNATTSTVSDVVQSDVRTQINNRSIVLRALAGDIVLNEGSTGSLGATLSDNTSVAVVGNGRVLIEAVIGDVIANANISSVAGDLSVIAGDTIRFASNANLITGNNAFSTGTLYIEAINGNVEQADGSQFIATLGDIRVAAGESIRLANVTTTAKVSLIAGAGSILDAGDADIDVSAAQLRLVAGTGIGLPGDHLDTDVGVISARAGGGGVFIEEAGALLIGDTSATVQRYNPDNSLTEIVDATLSDVRTVEGNGSIVVRTLAGDLTLSDGTALADNVAVVAHGAGNVRLEAAGANTDLLANADILSTIGHITLLAARDLRFAADADVLSGGVGTLNFEAGSGAIVMNDRTRFSTGSGDVRLLAADDIRLGGIETTGNVSLTSGTGSILDNGDFYTDVVASGLRMVAAVGIGSLDPLGVDPIETRVGTLTARATAGGINILEETDLTIDDVAVTVQRIGTDALGTATTDATQSDVRTTAGNGSIILRTEAGDITLNDGTVLANLTPGADNTAVAAHGSGNVLIEVLGATTGIEALADILSDEGHISLVAHGDVTLTATADVITSGDGTVFLEAKNGNVEQADNSRLIAANGDVRVWALNSVVLGGITTLANASLVALNGSISDAGDAFGGEDVVAAGLRLVAGIGIGAPTDGIETRVDVLSARATSGGIFIEETDALVIDGVGASVERVLADADTTTESDAVQSDVRTTAGDGSIVIRTLGGHLTLNDGAAPADNTVVSAHGAGNVRLEAAGTDTDLLSNADILSDFGHITLMAHRDLRFVADADVTTGGSGTLNLVADQGSVVMDDNVRFSTGSGNVRIAAATDVRLGGVATSGNVSLIAVNGSILDNGDTYRDVIANRLSMNAGVGVGELGAGTDNPIDTEVTTLSARATSGGVNVLEANALIVDAVEVSVQSVGIDAALTPTVSTEQTGVFTESGNGAIVLQTLTGDITLNDGSGLGAGIAVSANGSGNVLVEALGADTDLTLNSDLLSGTGHINLIATRDVALTAGSAVTTGGAGSVYLEATAGDVTQHDDSRMTSANGDVRVLAAGSIQVGGMTTDANVSLIAQSGSILDSGDGFGSEDIIADQLSLRAAVGIGASFDALEIDVTTLSARATSGGIFLLESATVTVGDTSATVRRILADATLNPTAISDATQSDLRTTSGNGAIVLQSLAGNIILNKGSAPASDTAISANGSGNVLVEALGAATEVTVNADVLSGRGHVNVLAGGDVVLTNTADLRTGVLGTLFVQAVSGSVVMADQSLFQTLDGDVRVLARQSITLGGIETSANVSLIASAGSILDGGNHFVDVVADQLRLVAGVGIGTSINALETTVGTLSARATSGGIFILESDSITVDDTSATVQRVAANASISEITDAVQSDVRTTSLNGSIVLRTTNGDIVLNAGTEPGIDTAISANGAGNVLIETLGVGTSITANADLLSDSGHVSVIAAADVDFSGTAEIQNAGNGTVFVQAASGSVTFSDSSRIQSLNGDIRVLADDSITLGGIETSANVSLIASNGSILDGGDTYVDVVADQLRLVAGIGVGASSNALETTVAFISARATSGGIFILESDSITVDDTSATVQRVEFDAGVSEITDSTQSDLRTTGGNGSIVLRTTDGDITLNEGDANGSAVSADAGGAVRIEAQGLGSALEADASVVSGLGDISLIAGADVIFAASAHLTTGLSGDLYVESIAGDVTQNNGSEFTSLAGNIRVFAQGAFTVGHIETAGSVSLIANTGSILDGGNLGDEDIVAGALRLWGANGIGAATEHLKIDATTLSAHAGAGGIFLLESNAISVESTAVAVRRVDTDAASSLVTDAAQTDVRTSANGSVVLQTVSGDFTLAAGNDVAADGTGRVLLQTAATGGNFNLHLDGSVLSGSGDLTVLASGSLELGAATLVRTSGTAFINLEARGQDFAQADGSRIETGSADIRILASNDLRLANAKTAGNVALIAETGSVLDNGNAHIDVIANGLRITAANGIGSLGTGSDALNTTVNTLSARATAAGINIRDTNGLIVGSVAVAVQRVTDTAGLDPTVLDAGMESVRTTTGNGSIVLQTLIGNLILNGAASDGVAISAHGAGNVLLRSGSTNLDVNGDVRSSTGHLSLEAASQLNINKSAQVVTAGVGSVDLRANSDSIAVSSAAIVQSVSGAVRLEASNSIILHGVVRTDANASLIANSGSITGGNSEGVVDVTAAGLRLLAGYGIGTAGVTGHALETQVSSISGRGNAGGIRILNTGDLEVAPVAVTVQRVDMNASSGAVTDTPQNDLINSNGGSLLVEVLEGGLTTQGVVTSGGSDPVRLAASGTISINSAITSADADVTVYGGLDVSLTAAGMVQVGGSGSIYMQSVSGGFVMAESARLVAANGNIRVFALNDLNLGEVSTSGTVSLISTEGIVLSAASTYRDVTANALRIEAVGAGTSADPLKVEVDVVAAQVSTNGLYLEDGSMLLAGTVGLSIDKVLNDGTVQSVTDTALTGVSALDGQIVLSALSDLTLASVVTNLSANLTSSNGAILNAGNAGANAQVGGVLTLSAENGIGRTGSGQLVIDAAVLELTNSGIGSVYSKILTTTIIDGLDLIGSGSLYLTQTTGDLVISGNVSVADGRAIFTTVGALTINADITSTDYLRIVSDSLDVNGAALTVDQGDIELRVRNDADFDATSLVKATLGNLAVVAGGVLRTGDMIASGDLNLRARGDILRKAGELTGTSLKIYSANGQIGASDADPILTNIDRLDVSAAGEISISEADMVEFGRSGLAGGAENPGETITVQVGTGTISSVNGNVEFTGDGTFLLESRGDLTLGTGFKATNGNIAIVSDTLIDGTPTEDILLEALNGQVSITATGNVGDVGILDIDIASGELSTTSASGSIVVELSADTTIVGDGIIIGAGDGALIVNQTTGSLFINANLAHFGSGNLNLVTVGTLTMNNSGRVITNSGAMDVFANGDFFISQVRTTSGTIRLETATGSILKISSFALPNIVATANPQIYVTRRVDLIVDSSIAFFNDGAHIAFRNSVDPYITIFRDLSP